MKELSRTTMAVVKRTAANVKSFRAKKAKLMEQRAKIDEELDTLDKSIALFEAPIIEVTGGYTSEQVLSGEMNVAEVTQSPEVQEAVTETNVPMDCHLDCQPPTQEEGGIPLFGSEVGRKPLPFEQ